ncbi:MAG: hypothetical protein HYX47_22935 [Burkholderiales bacterium]|nr:hypothetical protein [Burkholderiales bacterium]
MATWRLAANNTHLYPGARLQCLDTPGSERLAAGDAVLLEFADRNAVPARVLQAGPTQMTIEVPTHRTGQGAAIEARRWIVSAAWPAQAGALTVRARAH